MRQNRVRVWPLVRLLAGSQVRGKGAGRWIGLAQAIGLAIATCLVLTMVGGFEMFRERAQRPGDIYPHLLTYNESFVTVMMTGYMILAAFACVLIVSPLMTLTAASARVGAQLTEHRLAVLRLIGLSSRDVTRVALLEVGAAGFVGAIVGTLLYLVSVPAWSFVEFQGVAIGSDEMLLPAGEILLALVVVGVVALAAAWWGLKKVRIDPLGVSRLGMPKKLRLARLGVLVIAGGLYVAAFPLAKYVYRNQDSTSGANALWMPALIALGVLLVVIAALHVIVPLVIQLLARVGAHLPGASVMCAMRRIQRNPHEVWRRIGPLALLLLIAGMTSRGNVAATGDVPAAVAHELDYFYTDLRVGVIVTLAIVTVAVATQVAIVSVSDIMERANLLQALTRLGAPLRFLTRVAWIEVVVPIFLAFLALPLGYALIAPQVNAVEGYLGHTIDPTPAPAIVACCVVVAVIGVMAALEPFRRRIAVSYRRRND